MKTHLKAFSCWISDIKNALFTSFVTIVGVCFFYIGSFFYEVYKEKKEREVRNVTNNFSDTKFCAGEKKLLTAIFGERAYIKDGIKRYPDSSIIKPEIDEEMFLLNASIKKLSGSVVAGYVVNTDSLRINIPFEEYWTSDFSQESPGIFNTYVHEATHLWQNAVNLEYNASKVGYEYKLLKDSSLTTYGREQQASIVADYALRFIHPDKRVTIYNAQDSLLMNVVEKVLPQAQKTRIAIKNGSKAFDF